MLKKKFTLLLCFSLILISSLQAQSADDVLRYSLEYPSYDPVSLVMPAVSNASGFGSFHDNPASMALVEESFFSFDLSSRFIDETGRYLDNSSTSSDNQISVGDLGFVYKVPTVQGSLVIGGGYSQTTDYNRVLEVNAYNEESTITDFYNSSLASDPLFFAAYDAFALFDPDPDDDNYDNTSPAFRADPGGYQGIRQIMELTEEGQLGEYSLFMATEAVENLFIGGSIGYTNGTYSYRRDFLELDENNFYTDNSMDTDIDQILSFDRIDADIEAFNAQMGLIYQPVENLNVGVNYEFPSRLNIEEEYNTLITTTFDNGETAEAEAPGQFSYNIVRPQRIKAGATVKTNNGLKFTATAEGVFYTDARIEYDEIELNPQESAINDVVRSSFKDVVNMRGGLEYNVNDQFTPRVGYAYFPDPQGGFASDRQFINGGFSAELTKGLLFDFGLQYSFWDDQNELYSTPVVSEIAQEEVTRLHVMAGLRMIL